MAVNKERYIKAIIICCKALSRNYHAGITENHKTPEQTFWVKHHKRYLFLPDSTINKPSSKISFPNPSKHFPCLHLKTEKICTLFFEQLNKTLSC